MNPVLTTFRALHGHVSDHGTMLLLGVTALLAAGTVAVRLQRGPIHRQRLGEFTVGCTLLWVALAFVPMPRLAPSHRDAPAPGLSPATPEPARRLRLPATAPTDGFYVASYAAPDDPQLAELLSALTRPAGDGTRNARPLSAGLDLPVAPAAPRLTVRSFLAVAWLAGAFACSAWLLLGHVLLARMLRDAGGPPPWLRDLFEGLHRSASPAPGGPAPRLLVSDRCGRPVSCGVFRPAILLPAACVRTGNAAQLRHVLLHELGHVRQRDAVGNALFNVAMPLLYFHPLYWLVRSDVHLSRELVADDWAAARTGKSSYVAELISLARTGLPAEITTRGGGRWAAVGLFLFGTGSPTNFYRRMHMLMHRRDNEPLATRCSAAWRVASFAACGAALAAAVCVAGARPAAAQDGPAVAEVKEDRPAETDAARGKDDAEREALAASLAAKDQELRSAREQLDKAAYDAKRVEAMQHRRQVEVNAAAAQLDALKQQLAKAQAEAKSAGGDATAAQVDKATAKRYEELKKREAQIAKMHAKLEAEAVGLAKKQEAEAAGREWQARQRAEENAFKRSAPSGKSADVAGDLRLGDGVKGDAGGALNLDVGTLDLVGLATSYADAVGEVRIAEVRVQIAGEKGPHEQRLEQASLERSHQKALLLRRIAEIALRGAQQEYQHVEQLVSKKFASQSELAKARSKLEILELIFNTGGDSPSGQPRKL